MDATEIKGFANQMMQGVLGLQKSIEETMNNSFKNMSKEDAEKFAKAMKDSNIIQMAKEQTDKIIELNKIKKTDAS